MAPDPATVGCRQLLAMNQDGQIAVAMAAKDAMRDNADLQSMSDEEVLRLALAACTKHPDAKVLDAVKS